MNRTVDNAVENAVESAVENAEQQQSEHLEPAYISRTAAATLAVIGGSFGAHRFYFGQWWGVFYLLFCWTGLPWLSGLVEGILFMRMDQRQWNQRYNPTVQGGRESSKVLAIAVIGSACVTVFSALAILSVWLSATVIGGSQLEEAAAAIQPVLQQVEDYHEAHDEWPDNDSIDWSSVSRLKYVSAVGITRQSLVQIRFTADSGLGKGLSFSPRRSGRSGFEWLCRADINPQLSPPSACQQ